MIRITTPYAHLRLTVIAAPKDKIKRYQIKDPGLQMLVMKFEQMIPWDQIHSEDELIQYTQVMIKHLHDKIDPNFPDNYYIKDVDVQKMYLGQKAHQDQMEAQGQHFGIDPQLKEAYDIWQENKDAGRMFLLNIWNGAKKEGFDKWWNYVSDRYTQSPGFSFSVLKSIFDSSDSTRRELPPPLNEEALGLIYDEVRAGNWDFNTIKRYREEVSKIDQESNDLKTDKNGNGWQRIKSKFNDEKNFEKNVETLASFSGGTGWCTGTGAARPYLSLGDFYLYLQNGKAVAAIRMIKDNQMYEIVGIRNSFPEAYLDPIITFVNKNPDVFNKEASPFWGFQGERAKQYGEDHGFDISTNSFAAVESMNNLIAENPQRRAEFIKRIKGNPFTYNRLLKANRTPDMKTAAEQGFTNIVLGDVKRIAEIPHEFRKSPEMRNAVATGVQQVVSSSDTYVEFINNLPPEYNNDQQVVEGIKAGLRRRFFERAPKKTEYNELPQIFKEDPAIWEIIADGVTKTIAYNPEYFFDMPDEFKSNPHIAQTAMDEFEKIAPQYIHYNPINYDRLPDVLKQKYFEDMISGVPDYLARTNDPHLFKDLPEIAQKDPRVLAYAKKWFPLFMDVVTNFQYVPLELRNEPEILEPFEKNLLKYAASSPQYLAEGLPIEIINKYPNVKESIIKGCIQYIINEPNLYFNIYPKLEDPRLTDAYGEGMAREISNNPRLFWNLPVNLQRNTRMVDKIAEKMIPSLQRYPIIFKQLHPILRNHPLIRRMWAQKVQKNPNLVTPGQRKGIPSVLPQKPKLPPPNIPDQDIPDPRPNEQQLPPVNEAKTWYRGIRACFNRLRLKKS